MTLHCFRRFILQRPLISKTILPSYVLVENGSKCLEGTRCSFRKPRLSGQSREFTQLWLSSAWALYKLLEYMACSHNDEGSHALNTDKISFISELHYLGQETLLSISTNQIALHTTLHSMQTVWKTEMASGTNFYKIGGPRRPRLAVL